MTLGQKISSLKKSKKFSQIIKGFFIGFISLLVIDIIAFTICFTNKIGPFEKTECATNIEYIVK